MKNIFLSATLILLSAIQVSAQNNEWQNPSVASVGKDSPRSGFISYDIREDAESGVRDRSPFYLPLKMESTAQQGDKKFYITQTQIPYGWLDRDLFIHIEGAPAFYLYINDKKVGFGTDAKAATEFNISNYVTDGINTIRIESMAESAASKLEFANAGSSSAPLGDVYLYSQPKVRIIDYTITARPDSLGKNGIFEVEVAVGNSYNAPESVTVGYDIYSPAGKLQYYDMKDAKLDGRGTDTVRFKEILGGVMQNLWSSATPNLYRVMLYVKRSGRMIEYIPMKIGFGKTEFDDEKILRNGKVIAINAAQYNASTTPALTKTDLVKLKTEGINTICVDYPQKDWFYDLCDAVGLYVIDQANINNADQRDNLKIDGTTSNDPLWLNSYLERVQSMYARTRNHTCIIGWSLGGASGNGYNMYRGYQWLKEADPVRAVMYRDADGEWNSDAPYPQTQQASEVLSRVPVVKKPVRRR